MNTFHQYLPHFITWLASIMVFGGMIARTYITIKRFKIDEEQRMEREKKEQQEKNAKTELKVRDLEKDIEHHRSDDRRAFEGVEQAMSRIAGSSERRDQTLQDQIHKIEENTSSIKSSLDFLVGKLEK